MMLLLEMVLHVLQHKGVHILFIKNQAFFFPFELMQVLP
jgi:hypothetical protein